MVCVHRSGSSVSIPRRLSHHVPVVPIINWDPAEMERRETAEYQVLYCTVLHCTVLYSVPGHRLRPAAALQERQRGAVRAGGGGQGQWYY